ncbi:hypothetical protein H6P81_003142 [Aristolochia fimbriata]|uniref:Secreted protein n=1 Tax=Aristolochia fimbriata TaxID=158543 RepID=A0AAV7FDK1_ARIFI|nr:hypothetical protein H6P81_003142 [Aristolochia fimbriata]
MLMRPRILSLPLLAVFEPPTKKRDISIGDTELVGRTLVVSELVPNVGLTKSAASFTQPTASSVLMIEIIGSPMFIAQQVNNFAFDLVSECHCCCVIDAPGDYNLNFFSVTALDYDCPTAAILERWHRFSHSFFGS